jgi:guanosine-3',5'-bis(diphosphate) 3'-pyrophosphohydrolase
MFGIKDFDDDLMAAIEFATSYHGDQMYGDKPYLHHLMQVAMVLPRFGFHPGVGSEADQQRARNLILAAAMHDVVEDTSCTREDVAEVFGEAVALLVYAVSNEPGKNRRERHAKTHHKLIEIADAMILKLADRIANIETCHATKSPLLGMYRREWPDFKLKLKSATKAPPEMWTYLERLIAR